MTGSILPKQTIRLLYKLAKVSFLKPFYLTGGTALAIWLKYRQSEDLDFFTQKSFEPLTLQRELKKMGQLKDVEIAPGTLNLNLQKVKLQFLEYPYSLLRPLKKWRGINISSVLDIACTKLQTIGARGSKKDFIDLYFILKRYSLEELFKDLKRKYQGLDYNETHLLKSLVYFQEADSQPMPRMLIALDWSAVKETIERKVKSLKM